MQSRFRSFMTYGSLIALPLITIAGCDSCTATVSGQVTYLGKPVPGGSVVLYCSDKQIVRGLIGPDGRYSIPNVPCGPAQVTIQSPSELPAGMRLQQHLPPTTNGPVMPAAAGAPKAGRGAGLPQRYSLPEESGLSVIVDRGQMTYDIELKP